MLNIRGSIPSRPQKLREIGAFLFYPLSFEFEQLTEKVYYSEKTRSKPLENKLFDTVKHLSV